MLRIGPAMEIALSYIRRNPGCCAADVDRSCRTAKNGHRWMYETVKRLAKHDLIKRVPKGNRIELYAEV
jgi:predicted transcriptional regulator